MRRLIENRTMNIKSLVVEKPDKSKIWYKSSKDHSKWAITDQNSKPFVCIGDINRAVSRFTIKINSYI